MRKSLAAVALAAAALGVSAPAASAGCYGVEGWVVACHSGEIGTEMNETPVCVYTGGNTCETYYVPTPGVELPRRPYVCVFGETCVP